jgi:predicted O-methyltransferase YrrM
MGVAWYKWIAHREAASIPSPKRVHFIEAFSYEASRQLAGEFDFIFIDGDHSFDGIKRDWADWSRRLSKGGIIALHDSIVPDHNPSWVQPGSCAFFRIAYPL